ncbi:MAG: AAA family ATPase [Lachnospiraceae bacterium]|nr:AAA family ATPase [Lachnospiraceae bacterium]
MNISEEIQDVLKIAAAFAKQHEYEYITPEMIFLVLCDINDYAEAIEDCGADVSALKEKFENFCGTYLDRVKDAEPMLSLGVTQAVTLAGQQALNSGRDCIETIHLVDAMLKLPESFASYYFQEQGIEPSELIRKIQDIHDEAENDGYGQDGFGDTAVSPQGPEGSASGTESQSYAPCLNDVLQDVNPLIGREAELERTMEVLLRRDKNNPLYIGEPGVGKTAIVYGFVKLLNEGKVPDALKGSRVYSLDLGSMLAGTQYRGDFEKRLKKVLSDVEKEEKPIIFIDEIHNLSGAGAVGESSFDAANILKPYLSFGKVRFIGATTFDEHKKYFEKHKSLARRFQNIEIPEPSEEETVKILKGLKKKYEEFHGVKYAKGVLEYAASMSAKHINDRFLPDKAIDLLDESGAYRKLHPKEGGKQTVGKDVVAHVLTKICRVPIESTEADPDSNLATLEKRLKARIFGQDEAIGQVVNAVKLSRAGLSEENKPLASLLFVGPTGVGKTEVAKSLSEELGVKLIRFDMSEYEEKHAVAKLIGSPAGYVGYEEGGLLTGEIRKSPSSVLLLDEIEKAHPDIYNVLLQVMDYATLTDNQGRKADFRNVILIMTSNAGANRIGKNAIGFNSSAHDYGALMEEVKRIFQPEFRNRLSRIVSFNGMDGKMAELITDKKLNELKAVLEKKKISLNADKKAMELIMKKGITPEFGAREIDRVLRNEVKPLFVDEILFGRLKNGGNLTLTADASEFKIEIRKKSTG